MASCHPSTQRLWPVPACAPWPDEDEGSVMASPLFRFPPRSLCSGLDLVPQGAAWDPGIPLGVGLTHGRRAGSPAMPPARLPAQGSPCVTSPARTAAGGMAGLLSKKENWIEIHLIKTQPQLGGLGLSPPPVFFLFSSCQMPTVRLIVNISVRLKRKINNIKKLVRFSII